MPKPLDRLDAYNNDWPTYEQAALDKLVEAEQTRSLTELVTAVVYALLALVKAQ